MKKIAAILFFLPQILRAENTLSDGINSLFEPIVNVMAKVIFWEPFSAGIPIVVIWLVVGAIFFTIRMNFISIRGFKHALQLVRGDYDNPEDKGEVSHFQALTTALSATVGLGNIAGVAVAVSIGGPGATFWMIVAGLLGMSSKFVECTLGVKYRTIDENGEVSGGPMYYLKTAFEKRNLPFIGKIIAGLFAILCVGGSFGGGNMFQANQAFSQLEGQFSMLEGNGVYFGFILAVLVGAVIIGGIKSIANVTEKIVPFMAVLYVGASMFIIVMNYDQVFDVLALIFDSAFSGDAAKGGFVGVLVQGFRRAAFSNEAGVGSAAIAHSAVKTNEPVTEGIVALLEPFIDTVVICTMTAIVIIITGRHTGYDLEGAQLTSSAFESVISWFPMLLVVAIFLFAFSTMISWSYYGLKSWTYLFGKSKLTEYSYKLLFLIFIIIGSTVSLGAVIDFSDMMILAMAFPNILGLYMMSGEVRADLRDYLARVKSGAIKKFK
jgi:AGCS family alanine or glycine:cation symporter